jgi:glycine hydroxymethyltransferase
MTPGGVRLGTPALTTRGMTEAHMAQIADYCVRAIAISKRVQEKAGKKLDDFVKYLPEDEEVPKLAAEVKAFASQFPMPGQ